MAVNKVRYNYDNRFEQGISKRMGSDTAGGPVEVGRNHEQPDRPEDAVHINIKNIGMSTDEAREIAKAILRVAAEVEQMVEESKPKNSDILKELPAGSVFRVISEGVEEDTAWFTGNYGNARAQGDDMRRSPEWFDVYGWAIAVKYRND